MSGQPDQLSQLLLEADGLLLLLHRHRDETPVDAIKLLRKKLQLILALTDGLDEIFDENEADGDETPQEYIESTIESTGAENIAVGSQLMTEQNVDNDSSCDNHTPVHENSNGQTDDVNLSVDSPIEEPATDVAEYIEDTIETCDNESQDTKLSSLTSIESLDNSEQDKDVAFVSDTPTFMDDKPLFINESVVVKHDSNESMNNDKHTDEISSINNQEIQYHTETEDAPLIQNEVNIIGSDTNIQDKEPTDRKFFDEVPIYTPRLRNDDTSTLGTKQASSDPHASRRPVSSVFNLNDKFRFRRELFGNSDAQYVECLDLLSAMTSIDEAQEYLYDDLEWDSDNEDVKAFVELLSNYYK